MVSFKYPGKLRNLAGFMDTRATAYKVYVSLNGKGFANGKVVNGTSYTFENPKQGTVYYFKVTAVNDGGESFSTPVVAARTPSRGLVEVPFLIVDGFDRLERNQAVITNERLPKYAPLGKTRRLFIEQMNNFDYATQHAKSLSANEKAFDGATNEAVIDRMIHLSNYENVDWFLGRESSKDQTLSDTEQALLKSYLKNGGNLIISGSELAFDLVKKGNGKNFYQNYLKANFKGDDAGVVSFASFVNNQFGGIDGKLTNYEYGAYQLKSPDFISPLNGSQSILKYKNGQTAAVAYKGEYGVVNFAFPLETIGDEAIRNNLFKKSIAYLNYPVQNNTLDVKIVSIPKTFHGELTVGMDKVLEGKASLSLYTAMGKEVFYQKWSHDGRSEKTFFTQNIPKGVFNYTFEINGQKQIGWVIKE